MGLRIGAFLLAAAVVVALLLCSIYLILRPMALDQVRVVLGMPERNATLAATNGLEAHDLRVGGMERHFYVYVPPGIGPDDQVPLILGFHGGMGRAVGFGLRSGLVREARRRSIVLVLPQGIEGTWNTGGASPVGQAARTGIDDVAFVSALLDTMGANYPVDPDRTFAVGMSAGGMMSYRAACDLPGRFSAIAVVAGTMTVEECEGARGVSLLHIHGTDDQNVPWGGGAGRFSARGADWPEVSQGIGAFRAANQCGASWTVFHPARDTACKSTDCQDGERVALCRIEGGGHAWPGSPAAPWQHLLGVRVSRDFDATDHIARFLLREREAVP